MFSHVVIFRLKSEITSEQRQFFLKTLETLRAVPAVLFDIAAPAPSERPVVQTDYDYQLTTVFVDQAQHDTYQVHPLHKAFIAECAPLWENVRIFDAK